MNRKLLVLLAVTLFLMRTASAQAQLILNLNPAGLSGFPNTTLTFNATLINSGTDTLFLNGAGVSGLPPDLTPDIFPFFLNAPASLLGGDTWTGDILTVGIGANAVANDYVGSLEIVGGLDNTAQDSLASQFFLVTVVPEPGNLSLLMGTAVLGTGLLVRRRRSHC
jgi:hypothetical protein